MHGKIIESLMALMPDDGVLVLGPDDTLPGGAEVFLKQTQHPGVYVRAQVAREAAA